MYVQQNNEYRIILYFTIDLVLLLMPGLEIRTNIVNGNHEDAGVRVLYVIL